jgi:hypothetical protein
MRQQQHSEARVTGSCQQQDKKGDGCNLLQLLQVSQTAATGQEHHEVEHDGYRISVP